MTERPPPPVEPPRLAKSWLTLVRRLVLALSVAIVVIAVLIEFIIVNHKATHAATDAKNVATCVNTVLADRQKVSDTPALLEEAQADADWSQAVLGLFSLPPHPTEQQARAETATFLNATKAYAQHKAHAAAVLKANQAYRDAHPLGKC